MPPAPRPHDQAHEGKVYSLLGGSSALVINQAKRPAGAGIRHHILPGSSNEDFEETLERVRQADLLASFNNLDDLDLG